MNAIPLLFTLTGFYTVILYFGTDQFFPFEYKFLWKFLEVSGSFWKFTARLKLNSYNKRSCILFPNSFEYQGRLHPSFTAVQPERLQVY